MLRALTIAVRSKYSSIPCASLRSLPGRKIDRRKKLHIVNEMDNFEALESYKPQTKAVKTSDVSYSEAINSVSSTTWAWLPPRTSQNRADDDDVIPVIPGLRLTALEIKGALERLAGEDITILKLKTPLDTISEFVICTGRSTRHLKKMSDSIVRALKKRGLREAPGFTGAEGEKDDDWVVVDCFNCAVHFMLPGTRKAIDLESHWCAETRPVAVYSRNEREYEENFNRLLELYPIPDGYDPAEKDREAAKFK